MIRIRNSMLAALCVGLACTDPVGPELTEIVVRVDWAVARQPGFVDARWQVIEYDADDWIPRGPVVAEGEIGADGLFTVRFEADCSGGEWGPSGYRIEVTGHFETLEGRVLPDCTAWVPHRCSNSRQTAGIGYGSPEEACEPPPASLIRTVEGGR
ncbi:MAG: hypothetical protein P8125_07945 [Gemmatimonadota bacterium]